jgi:outer membrane protein assembly factor BamB
MMKCSFALITTALVTACGGSYGAAVQSNLQSAPQSRTTLNQLTGYSVTYQVNPAHTGYVAGLLNPPLTERWAVKLGGYNGGVGYPIVANGIVVVGANGKLFALNAKTGKILWSRQGSPGGWVGPAYDNGMIFSDPLSTSYGKRTSGIYAFNQRSGKVLWAASMQQWSFSSPPTARSGMVYTAGAGDGGTVYAYNESTGALAWSASVMNGDDSSPAVTSRGVYVSYSCPQSYDFNPVSGKQIWHYNGSCEGGGGSTPVYYDGFIFVEASDARSGYNGLILTADKGKAVGYFNSNFTPAFANLRGFFITGYGATLQASDIPSMRPVWTVTLSGDKLATPPLLVGKTVYAETAAGNLLAYDAKTGHRQLDMSLGYSGGYAGKSVGLGFGSNELIVPDGNELIALTGS